MNPTKDAKTRRSLDLLRPWDAKDTPDWFACVPECFNLALDIKLTERKKTTGHTAEAATEEQPAEAEGSRRNKVWTQGRAYSFKAGDGLYDSANGYLPWLEALQELQFVIRVEMAREAGFVGTDWFDGFVGISVSTPNPERSRVVQRFDATLSQDQLVDLLQHGPKGTLAADFERAGVVWQPPIDD